MLRPIIFPFLDIPSKQEMICLQSRPPGDSAMVPGIIDGSNPSTSRVIKNFPSSGKLRKLFDVGSFVTGGFN